MIIRPDQLGTQQRNPETALPRQSVTVFAEARMRPPGQQAGAVAEQVRAMFAAGTLRLTSILNEAEPLRTYALEVLTGWSGTNRSTSYLYQLASVRLRHRGGPDAPPIKVVTERRPVSNSRGNAMCETRTDAGVRHVRIVGDWMPGQEIDLPFEQAIGTLYSHGWYVSPHIALRLRRKYRMLVELDRDGVPVMHDGAPEPTDTRPAADHTITAAEERKVADEAARSLKVPEAVQRRARGEA